MPESCEGSSYVLLLTQFKLLQPAEMWLHWYILLDIFCFINIHSSLMYFRFPADFLTNRVRKQDESQQAFDLLMTSAHPAADTLEGREKWKWDNMIIRRHIKYKTQTLQLTHGQASHLIGRTHKHTSQSSAKTPWHHVVGLRSRPPSAKQAVSNWTSAPSLNWLNWAKIALI